MADPPAPPPAVARPTISSRPVAAVAALLVALSTAPYARAALSPPAGTAFTGYFWYVDDAYNYLSYVQQAEDGAVLFRNKLVAEPHHGALLNPEWWIVGVLSRALGRSPLLAYRLFAIAAIVALVAGIHRFLLDAGITSRHALPALLLVCLGGGAATACLGSGRPPMRCLDLGTGLFPVLEVMANPHFVAGTALLLWSLRAFRLAGEGGGPRQLAIAAALATVLGLTRPYDLVLLAAIRGLVVLATEPPRRWARHAAVMAVLLPVVAYLGWVFYAVPAFAGLAQIRYEFPPPADFAWALGPAALVGAGAWAAGRGRRVTAPETRSAVAHLGAWLVAALVMMVFHPVNFALQFMVGVGVPLLGLTALALAAFPPAATYAALALLGTTVVEALRLTLLVSPAWFVPRERIEAAYALRGTCRAGDVVMAPPDIGLYAGGVSACTPWVSHGGGPGFAEKADEARRFYGTPDPATGRALLERACAAHVVLPAGQPLESVTASAAEFRVSALTTGAGRAIAIHSRPLPAACAGPR